MRKFVKLMVVLTILIIGTMTTGITGNTNPVQMDDESGNQSHTTFSHQNSVEKSGSMIEDSTVENDIRSLSILKNDRSAENRQFMDDKGSAISDVDNIMERYQASTGLDQSNFDYNIMDTTIQPLPEAFTDSLTPHSAISISSDSEFQNMATNEGWSGSGTATDPYIIENYNFTFNSDTAITIGLTSVSFIIRNSYFDMQDQSFEAIDLNSLTGGNVSIANNTIENADRGIDISAEDVNLHIDANTFRNIEKKAVRTDGTTSGSIKYVRFAQNHVNITGDDGILIRSYSSAAINNSFIGITWTPLEVLSNLTYIANNYINGSNSGISTSSTSSGVISNNTITNISVNALQVGLNVTIIDNTLINGTRGVYVSGGSLLYSSTNGSLISYITGNHITGQNTGIELYQGFNSSIIGNYLNGSSTGILLDQTNNSLVGNNHVEYNGDGIHILNSMANGIINNTINQNDFSGILLDSSTDNIVIENHLDNNQGSGIFGFEGHSSIFLNNSITQLGTHGINLQVTNDTVFANNIIQNSGVMGMYVTSSYNITVFNTTIDNSGASGFRMEMGSDTSIYNSSITNSASHGIHLLNTVKTLVRYNKIVQNVNNGIYGKNADFQTISDNNISLNMADGIQFEEIIEAYVTDNIFQNNTQWGIDLDSTTNFTLAWHNDFLFNHYPDFGQISNNGQNNSFFYNFYNEWTSPDNEPDGIVDFSYDINGTGHEMYDFYPKALPNHITLDHYIGVPTITSPSAGGLVDVGNVEVIWEQSDDNLGHDVVYDVLYSEDQQNWTTIASDETSTLITWDTTSINEGEIYLRVVAKDTTGLANVDTIEVEIKKHEILNPVITSPEANDTLTGTVTVEWLEADDTWGHTLQYQVSISSDGGTTYTELVTDLNTLSYSWNTTKNEGGTYLLRVTAFDNDELQSSDTITVFVDDNHTLSKTTIQTPEAGETISGLITIEWMPAQDSLGHEVTYTVQYSSDNGGTWNDITFGLTNTSINWDTSQVNNGDYTLRVQASDGQGLLSVDTTDGTFTIDNVADTSSETDTQTGGQFGIGFSSIGALGIMLSIFVAMNILIRRKRR